MCLHTDDFVLGFIYFSFPSFMDPRNISAAWAKEDSKNETEEGKIARQNLHNVSICLSSIPTHGSSTLS